MLLSPLGNRGPSDRQLPVLPARPSAAVTVRRARRIRAARRFGAGADLGRHVQAGEGRGVVDWLSGWVSSSSAISFLFIGSFSSVLHDCRLVNWSIHLVVFVLVTVCDVLYSSVFVCVYFFIKLAVSGHLDIYKYRKVSTESFNHSIIQ